MTPKRSRSAARRSHSPVPTSRCARKEPPQPRSAHTSTPPGAPGRPAGQAARPGPARLALRDRALAASTPPPPGRARAGAGSARAGRGGACARATRAAQVSCESNTRPYGGGVAPGRHAGPPPKPQPALRRPQRGVSTDPELFLPVGPAAGSAPWEHEIFAQVSGEDVHHQPELPPEQQPPELTAVK
ncbi:atherin-like [Camelus ferus]|uniref:Atherin-like n=1 Tax=Camelus ferus TaxID=419612 RepID=A0A8B8SAM8_CAMFR|nr:atherin-like [Camelus ferus]